VITLQTDDYTTAPSPTTFGELMEWLDIVIGIFHMLQATSGPGSGHIRQCLAMGQLNSSIPKLEPRTEGDLSPWLKAKPV